MIKNEKKMKENKNSLFGIEVLDEKNQEFIIKDYEFD